MNIFVLDKNPYEAARQACDKHVVKMILESAQMLCAVHPEGVAPYKRSFYNHPCTKWVRRYGKTHKSEEVIQWCRCNRPYLPIGELTKHPKCMPDKYKVDCVVKSYQNYYNGEKAYFAKWKDGPVPSWFTGVFR